MSVPCNPPTLSWLMPHDPPNPFRSGTTFQTERTTLQSPRVPAGSRLARLVTPTPTSAVTTSLAEPIFVDRDPVPFCLVLQYLREPGRFRPALARLGPGELWALQGEAAYFGLVELATWTREAEAEQEAAIPRHRRMP
jgi:hypothetical protein